MYMAHTELYKRINSLETQIIFKDMRERMHLSDIERYRTLINIFKENYPTEYSLAVEERNRIIQNRRKLP